MAKREMNELRVNGFALVAVVWLKILLVSDVTMIGVTANCSLLPVNASTHDDLKKELIDTNTYLIRYKLHFPAGDALNALAQNLPTVYKPDSYNRIRNKHGQTLLTLAFNYGVVSLMTLTYGTADKTVSVMESPADCLTGLSESDTLNVILYLLARDFDPNNQTVSIVNDERICLRYIESDKGVAEFKPRCYNGDNVANVTAAGDVGNRWIEGLYILIAIAKLLLIGFGPLLFVQYVSTLSQESIPYVVKLKEPIVRTLFVAKSLSDFEKVRGDRVLNLRKCRGYPKLKQTLETSPFGRPFLAKISEYDILAASSRLIMENEVPVTFWGALAEAVFRCKVKDVGPMQSCCYIDMFRDISCIERRYPWIDFWTKVGNGLLIIFLPFLYYLRLILFYVFEVKELNERNEAAKKLGLSDSFDNSLVHYFRPDHWIFLCIYAIYFVSAFVLAFVTRSDNEGRFRNIVVGSFADLRRLSFLRVFQMMIENFLFPFKRYGCLGCLVAIAYWPTVLPLTLIVSIFYSIPTMYLTFRMIFYSRRAFLEQIRTRSGVRKYQMSARDDNNLDLFQVDFLLGARDDANQPAKLSEIAEKEVDELEKFRTESTAEDETTDHDPGGGGRQKRAESIIHTMHIRPSRLFQHALASFLSILALYALLVIVAECLGSLVEITVFTLMGIIVNSDLTAKYAGLVLMVVVYTYDCFNNIQLRYFKLNKYLFADIRGRVKGLDNVTSLPSYLQENQGFKAQEQSDQAAHEHPDDIAPQPSRHWLINDLVLFVDNEDAFRIPRRLFKQVCEIHVSGVPGPIHEGVIEACVDFLKMVVFVVFVFLVVLSFGDIYELSGTTQMMAVLATGFLPIILKQFMEPQRPDIEVNSLSFKSKLDEVIKNFWQLWPIHDFTFTPLSSSYEPTEGPSGGRGATEERTSEDKETKPTGRRKDDDEEKAEEMSAVEKVVATAAKGPPANGRSVSIEGGTPSVHSPTPARGTVAGDHGRKTAKSSTLYQVDLLIRLPERYEDQWVDGWSNIIEMTDPKRKHAASNAAQSMMDSAAAGRTVPSRV